MTQQNLFDDVADIGREFLALGRGHQALQKYTWQLRAICDLIKHTHSIVVSKLDAIEATMSLESARNLVAQLEDEPLTASFRANGLCDIFQGFGLALRKIVSDPNLSPGTRDQIPISQQHLPSWSYFCDALEQREGEVASLYAHEIQEIGDLVFRMKSTENLDGLKGAAKRARDVLTSQMADFDSLASQFEQLLKEPDSHG